MKFLAAFVAMYLVALSIFPCGDKEDCKLDYDRYSAIIDLHHNASPSHGAETCSPFCSCDCCSISMTELPSLFALEAKVTFWDGIILYKTRGMLESPSAIWQPPQLG